MNDNTNYKKLYEYYKSEADVFAMFYDDELKYARAVLTFAGVIASMISDSLSYELKHGKNEKIKPLNDRIEILRMIYSDIRGIEEKNVQLRFVLASKNKRMQELVDENTLLKAELQAVEKSFKAE